MTASSMSPYEAASAYVTAGLSVLPTKGKRPVLSSWAHLQQRRASTFELKSWFKADTNVAIIGGKVSGNLDIFDFDNGGELFRPWLEIVNDRDPELAAQIVWERTPSGGYHVYVRCAEATIAGNTKLAARLVDGKAKALIETRGEGGYCLCWPSTGYVLEQGELTAIPSISADQHRLLHEAARSLTEIPPQPMSASTASGDKPGDEYNAKADIRALLQQHGWAKVGDRGQTELWRRPGKQEGHSATLLDGKIFYVFSSNADPFENDKSYMPFGVYAMLEHGGDYAAASAALRKQGYGASEPEKPALTTATPKDAGVPLLSQFRQEIAGKRFACIWPWRLVHVLTQALAPDTITVFAAVRGTGKTFFILQALSTWVEKGYNPAYLGLEEDRTFFLRRLLAQKTGVADITYLDWVRDNPQRALELHAKHADWLNQMGASIHESTGVSDTKRILAWIEAVCKAGCRIVVVDPVSVRALGNNIAAEDTMLMSVGKDIAKKYGASLVYVGHPPKTSEDPKKGGWGVDVGGGANLQNLASNVFVLRRYSDDNEAQCKIEAGVQSFPVNRGLHLTKTRSGRGDGACIGFWFDRSTLTFKEQGIIV